VDAINRSILRARYINQIPCPQNPCLEFEFVMVDAWTNESRPDGTNVESEQEARLKTLADFTGSQRTFCLS